ncbi:putative LRR receptor-like serine/threonine-protein kinase isoform X2 [Cinnamomum micranthum f. kanehirae]|uniref:Putative LRR receptor-like serine/threonine-protein kinase isoform X2 n=1 Tax=Cinnamomum micranthum f. kanehirae TaxID=337451 RepID=A0A443NAH3_9MAGN|nr:putative LRR receptor-like serine/threonine-protein kinase isoform X2 [Cinnamomum micranthum f. kanehirae]
MGWPPAFYLWVVFFALQLRVYGCFGCFYEEESALLELKSSINHPNRTYLPSWRVGTNCCTWKGITCSSTVGRVIALNLSSTRDYLYNEYWSMNEWYILKLSRLRNLETLDLSHNNLMGPIPPSIGLLASLKFLGLSSNGFNDSQSIQELSRLRNLETLDLSHNNLMGPIPPSIGLLASLKFLGLSSNRFNDSQSIQGLCNLKNLRELNLVANELEGTIPSCLSNLRNLQILDLSSNQLSGKIPACLIANLSSLLYFSLASNNFSAHLLTFPRSRGFDLSNNNLEVETEYPKWNSTFQVKVLGLSNCKLNKRAGTIPSFLYGQHDLILVDLSHNNLSGQFPFWLLVNNTGLELLNLKNNSLETFNLPVHGNNTELLVLDVSYNHITGQLPLNIGTLLPNLVLLNMSRNFFQGSIPPSVGDMRSLETLDLSHNNLSEEIPKSLVAGSVYLRILKLSNNNLHGKILSTFSNLTYLRHLYLDSNHFTGTIPASLFNISLQVLDIGDNQISGRIPSQIGDLPSLFTLILRSNHIDGMVPLDFCRLTELGFLDLSDNSLSGPIPSCLNLTNLEYMHLEKNAFSGSIPSALSKSSYLISLGIGYNDIVGAIPSWIGALTKLRVLLLRRNSLHGHIPIALCQLKYVSLLDLSYNHLSGQLPPCINNLTFGRSILDSAFYIQEIQYFLGIPWYVSQQAKMNMFGNLGLGHIVDVTDDIIAVEFMTKNIWNYYSSGILNLMSGDTLETTKIPNTCGPPKAAAVVALNKANKFATLEGDSAPEFLPTCLVGPGRAVNSDVDTGRLDGGSPAAAVS